IEEIRRWMSTPLPTQKVRDHLMVRMTAAHLADPMLLCDQLTDHMTRCRRKLETLKAYESGFFAMTGGKTLQTELVYLSLLRGIELQESWLAWAEKVRQTLKKYAQQE
ncbi:MAG: hypothetical protein R3208_22730, partial [Ketobacteraceae bacterium]|nr:hypothetical protein [Ketobacteraceae bacterium]